MLRKRREYVEPPILLEANLIHTDGTQVTLELIYKSSAPFLELLGEGEGLTWDAGKGIRAEPLFTKNQAQSKGVFKLTFTFKGPSTFRARAWTKEETFSWEAGETHVLTFDAEKNPVLDGNLLQVRHHIATTSPPPSPTNEQTTAPSNEEAAPEEQRDELEIMRKLKQKEQELLAKQKLEHTSSKQEPTPQAKTRVKDLLDQLTKTSQEPISETPETQLLQLMYWLAITMYGDKNSLEIDLAEFRERVRALNTWFPKFQTKTLFSLALSLSKYCYTMLEALIIKEELGIEKAQEHVTTLLPQLESWLQEFQETPLTQLFPKSSEEKIQAKRELAKFLGTYY